MPLSILPPSPLRAIAVQSNPPRLVIYVSKKPSHLPRSAAPERRILIDTTVVERGAGATAGPTTSGVTAGRGGMGAGAERGARKWAGGPGGSGGRGWTSDAAGPDVMGSVQQFGEGEIDINGHGDNRQYQNPPKLLTLPTVLTLGRVAAVPFLVSAYHMNGWWATSATTCIFLAAAFTDWLDGYVARKMRLGTAFGAFLDPVADKLMVAATLVLLCTKPLEVAIFGEMPWLLTAPSIAIIGREITMSAVREWAASQNSRVLEAVAVNSLGKWKTATQMAALTILLATRDPSLAELGAIVASGVFLLYISAGLAVWSLALYISKIWRILLK